MESLKTMDQPKKSIRIGMQVSEVLKTAISKGNNIMAVNHFNPTVWSARLFQALEKQSNFYWSM